MIPSRTRTDSWTPVDTALFETSNVNQTREHVPFLVLWKVGEHLPNCLYRRADVDVDTHRKWARERRLR